MQIIRDSISKFWYEHFCHNRSPREDKKDSECRKKKQKKSLYGLFPTSMILK